MFYINQGSVAWFSWLGSQLCFLNLMTWLCVSQKALANWWFKNDQVERAHYSALIQVYVRKFCINSAWATVCLLTLLHSMTTRLNTVCNAVFSVCLTPSLCLLVRTSQIAMTEDHHQAFSYLALFFLCTFPFTWNCTAAHCQDYTSPLPTRSHSHCRTSHTLRDTSAPSNTSLSHRVYH